MFESSYKIHSLDFRHRPRQPPGPEFVESSWYLVVVGGCIDLQSAPELWEFTGGKMIFYDLPGWIWHFKDALRVPNSFQRSTTSPLRHRFLNCACCGHQLSRNPTPDSRDFKTMFGFCTRSIIVSWWLLLRSQ